jgi:hypothetical protein
MLDDWGLVFWGLVFWGGFSKGPMEEGPSECLSCVLLPEGVRFNWCAWLCKIKIRGD